MAAVHEPLLIEIIAFAPTAYYHCQHCEVAWRAAGVTNGLHDEQIASSLPPDLAQDYQAVSDWVHELFRQHCDAIRVNVVDAASVEGLYKSLRHGVRRYPAVIVGSKARFAGRGQVQEALEAARREVDRLLAPASTEV